MDSIRFGVKLRIWVPCRETTYLVFLSFVLWGRKHAASHTTLGSQPRGKVDESDRAHHRVRAAAGLCRTWAVQAGKLSLSASLGWAEEALKRHARDNDGDAAIDVLSYSTFRVLGRSLGCVALGRSS